LPDATGTVSLIGAAETLVGKTLTAPKFADAGFIADSQGNEQVIFQETASAVNEIEITNAATGGANNQGAIRLNCENNTHGQTLMSQPHGSSDSGFFQLPKDGGSARATPNTLLSGDKTVATVQALSGAGAISLNTLHTALTTTGAQAQTLANGVNGQIKTISMVADGGDGTLTPATFANGTTITFNDVGDSVMLIYNTTGGWALISNTGCTIA